jgi:aminoglycoside phosphotransferase
MISINPRINLAADKLLPQRDILLNTDEVASRLSSRLGTNGPVTINSCERVRTKYRFGESLRVLHRIRVGHSTFTVAARTFPEGRSERAYERALSETLPCSPLRPVIHDQELDTVFWTFPNDRKLSGLQTLTSVPADVAQAFVPGWKRSRLVAYAPEKSATAQCLDEGSNVLAYAKVYQGDEGQHIFGIYQALRRSLSSGAQQLELPRALVYSDAHQMLLLESIEGERLIDLGGLDLLNGYKRLGAALAVLHSLPVPDGLGPFKRLEVKRIRQAARLIGLARPDVQHVASDLADALTVGWKPSSATPVCLHGDVHPKNGLLRDECLTLIDFDQAGFGEAAADLGSFMASLSYNYLSGLLPDTTARELEGAFLTGYAALRELPEKTTLRWHTAAALLAERALRAVNRIRPEGLDCLPALLMEARHVLQSGGKR